MEHTKPRKMEGKSMRKLNRVIAAAALAVPMALGASGVAVAQDSSGTQSRVDAAGGNSSNGSDGSNTNGSDGSTAGQNGGGSGDECDSEDDGFGGLGEGLRNLLGVGDDECDSEDILDVGGSEDGGSNPEDGGEDLLGGLL